MIQQIELQEPLAPMVREWNEWETIKGNSIPLGCRNDGHLGEEQAIPMDKFGGQVEKEKQTIL